MPLPPALERIGYDPGTGAGIESQPPFISTPTLITNAWGTYYEANSYLSDSQIDANARYIASFLLGEGWDMYMMRPTGQVQPDNVHASPWTKKAIAAMLGNAFVESKLSPTLIENRQSDGDPYNIPSNRGYGLAQWTGTSTGSGNLNKYVYWADANGFKLWDMNAQLARFAWCSAQSDQGDWLQSVLYPISIKTFWSDDSYELDWLTRAWWVNFERGGTDIDLRIQKAQYFFNLIQNVKPVPVWPWQTKRSKWIYYMRRRNKFAPY